MLEVISLVNVAPAFMLVHKGHIYSFSLNRGIEVYLFCMWSLATSAIAYRAECTLVGRRGGGLKGNTQKKAATEEGVGGFC